MTLPSIESMNGAIWSKYLDSSKTSRYHWSGYLSTVIQNVLYPLHFPVNGVYMSQMEMSGLLRKNNDASLAAVNAILPFPIRNSDSGDVQNTLKVLKSGEFQSESVNLTTRKPFDRVSFRILNIIGIGFIWSNWSTKRSYKINKLYSTRVENPS